MLHWNVLETCKGLKDSVETTDHMYHMEYWLVDSDSHLFANLGHVTHQKQTLASLDFGIEGELFCNYEV